MNQEGGPSNDDITTFILREYEAEIRHLLSAQAQNFYYDFPINLLLFANDFPTLLQKFYRAPLELVDQLQNCVIDAQKVYCSKESDDDMEDVQRAGFSVKEYISIPLESIPLFPDIYRQSISLLEVRDLDRMVVINATVIRVANRKSLEKAKTFQCSSCGFQVRGFADYVNMNKIQIPPRCTNRVVKQKKSNPIFEAFNQLRKKNNGNPRQNNFNQNSFNQSNNNSNPDSSKKLYEDECGCSRFEPIPESQEFIDYQEIKLQESFRKIKPGNIPRTIWVILEGNLVDRCSPGDDIRVSGTLIRRWKKVQTGSRPDVTWSILANDIVVQNKEREAPSIGKASASMSLSLSASHFEEQFELFWFETRTLEFEIDSRNRFITSVCSQIFERYEIKLALLLCLIGGVALQQDGTKIRGLCHMLLVGEPGSLFGGKGLFTDNCLGTGKSQLLRYASNLSSRSVFTNGIGSTAAGLTVSCIKEAGEWMFEAGALVLADMGVCCVDEFNLLQKSDLVSVHEAMEQQTISVSKAGLTSTAYSRATIIASCNPISPGQKYDSDLNLVQNTGLATPLLSRFDLIFVVVDEIEQEKDLKNCDFILGKFYREVPDKIDGPRKDEIEWDTDSLREYIQYVQQKFDPIISPEAEQVLQSYYKYCRVKDIHGRSTIRLLESLIRLCQAHTRLMFRDRGELFDAIAIIILMESAFHTGLLPSVNLQELIIIKDVEQYKEVEKMILKRLDIIP